LNNWGLAGHGQLISIHHGLINTLTMLATKSYLSHITTYYKFLLVD